MKIDSVDLRIIRAIENGGKIFPSAIERQLNLDLKSRISRLESKGLIKNYKALIRIPAFIGGNWTLGCLVGIASNPETAINQVSKKLPFVTEIMQNISLPEGIGPNLSILFYTKDFLSSVHFIKELSELNYSEIYKLREYSFPIPTPLTTNEKLLLKEIYLNPLVSFEELSQITGQSLAWVSAKVNRLVTNPENIETDLSNQSGIMQILPEIDWRVCENFCHIHFIIENLKFKIQNSRLTTNEFELVLSGRPFREKFCQLETDLWGFNQLGTKVKLLQQSEISIKGIILAESNLVINHWVPKLLE